MQPKEIATLAAQVLNNKKAIEVRALEVTSITVLADYFLVCSATSNTHIRALSGEVEMKLKEQGILPHHVEGHMSGNWILMDYGCVIIHIFLQETRDFYELERLWRDATEVHLID